MLQVCLQKQDIIHRLETEIQNDKLFQIQYWPIIELSTEQLIGCCGIRPFDSEMRSYEIGFHLRKKYWGMGYASEAAKAVIAYSFDALKADKLCAPPPIYTGRRLHISDCWFMFVPLWNLPICGSERYRLHSLP